MTADRLTTAWLSRGYTIASCATCRDVLLLCHGITNRCACWPTERDTIH